MQKFCVKALGFKDPLACLLQGLGTLSVRRLKTLQNRAKPAASSRHFPLVVKLDASWSARLLWKTGKLRVKRATGNTSLAMNKLGSRI